MQEAGTDYSCKEDGVTDNLIKLLVSEGILRYAYYIYWFFHHKIKSNYSKDYDYQQDFELSDEFVWVMVLNSEFWCGLILYPILAWIAVPSLWLHTKFLIYRLQKMKR